MRALTLILAMMVSLAACAETETPAVSYVAGKDYMVLEVPVATNDASKIEVVEAFWYGCGHCRNFEPVVHAWSKQQAADVDLVYLPAMWNKPMEAHARLFYAASNLKVESKIRAALFNTLHNEYQNKNRNALTEIKDIAAFVKTHAGIDEETFTKQYKSFGVTSQVKKSDANFRGYKMSGTPAIAVDGKYLITGQSAGGQENMLKIVDFLVAKIRQERG